MRTRDWKGYSEPNQTFIMGLFVKIVIVISSISEAWLDFQYASALQNTIAMLKN